MGYDYDALYRAQPNALGMPTQEFVRFFDAYDLRGARVLDVGCGQGRDAVFIARMGHSVLGIDISPHGIRDLVATAAREGLDIRGAVVDITAYTPPERFDIVLIDRTLHMLGRDERIATFARLIDAVENGGWLLLADEPSNMADFQQVLRGHTHDWDITPQKRGFLFARSVPLSV